MTFGGFEIIPSTSVNELGRMNKFAPIAHDGEDKHGAEPMGVVRLTFGRFGGASHPPDAISKPKAINSTAEWPDGIFTSVMDYCICSA